MKNKPYVKQYDAQGNLINPITKSNAYKHDYLNRQRKNEIKDFVHKQMRKKRKDK